MTLGEQAAGRRRPHVLLVDDDRLFAGVLASQIRESGYHTELAASLAAARELLGRNATDVVLLDMMLPDGRGTDLLPELQQLSPPPVVICLTSHDDVDSAVGAMRAGASDYVLKSTAPVEVLSRIHAAIERAAQQISPSEPSDGLATELLGESDEMKTVRRSVRLAANTDITVLLSGETGTGKSHAARLVHRNSSRADRPFVTVDCAALAESVADSELFGHVRGAFTGADRERTGTIQAAGDGTVFFDEISDMPLGIQGKLLRVMEERVVRPVGGNKEYPIRARIIAATRCDLAGLVERRKFREDLYYRLSVLEIRMPPLRRRAEDIPRLLSRLVADNVNARAQPRLTDAAMATLQRHQLPGNVRELRNLAKRMVLMCQPYSRHVDERTLNQLLGGTDITSDPTPTATFVAPAIALERGRSAAREPVAREGSPESSDEARQLARALLLAGGRIGDAADQLGISRHALRRRLKKLSVKP